MNLKYITKKIAAVCLIAVLCMGGLTGCGNDTKIVFTTGLSGNQIFKIGSKTCTTPEIMIYLTTFYNQYVNIYGEEMWHYDFGGVSLEEHVKDVVLSKMAQIKIMNLMAEEQNIKLSEKEEKQVLAAAECYYSKLEDDLKSEENITESIVQEVYREYALANKVYATITESADMEISDDEARTVTVQEIRCSDQKETIKNYTRGSTDPAYEELLFSMDEGDVSDVIELEDGSYIVKCISTMDYEATQENKLVLAEKRKQEAFSKAYTEIAANTHSQFRDKQWEKITLNEEIHSTEANFFDIYDEYIKQ